MIRHNILIHAFYGVHNFLAKRNLMSLPFPMQAPNLKGKKCKPLRHLPSPTAALDLYHVIWTSFWDWEIFLAD
jgi:hypothetical protein